MKMYRSLIRKNLAGIAGTAFLIMLEALGMSLAGYSLSFFFTAYEYEGNKVKTLCYTFAIVTMIWLLAMLFYYIALLAQAKIQQKLKNRLRSMVGGTISSMSYTDFTDKDSGNFVSWLTNDVEQIYVQSFSSLFSGVECLFTAVFSFGALILLSPWIGLAAIVLLIIISILPQLLNKQLQRANAERSNALETATEAYKDAVMGGSVFFLTTLRDRIRQRILKASEKAEKVCFRFNRTNMTVQILISTVSMLGQTALLFVTLLAAVFGAASVSALLSVGNLAGSFFNGSGSLVQCFMTVRASKPLWEKIEASVPEAGGGRADVKAIPQIRLENVSFSYKDRQVLEDIGYTFNAGGKYAVMGESGSGKTTLARIILGLLPNYSGKVMYGDQEQRELKPESLYGQIACVDQQVYLFADTIRFNITLGEPYRDEEVAAVIRKCRLEEYISSLTDGLETVILENGKDLSGGQRQRVALARSLIRRARYIILDEGTSALDEENAALIENELMDDPNLCVIIITHNLRGSVREKLTGIYNLKSN